MNRTGRFFLTLLFAVDFGLAIGLYEAVMASRAGHPSYVVHVSTYLILVVISALASSLLFEWIPGVRRLGPMLAVAGAVGACVFTIHFLRTHVDDDLVHLSWSGREHRLAAGRAALWGGSSAVVVLLLTGAFHGLATRVIRWRGVPPALIGLTLVAFVVAGFQASNPYRVKVDPDLGRGELPCNVLWITIDTLRRDHLTQYGYQRPTSDALDAFDMTRFDRCSAVSNWTKPATASMMTGMYPSVHTAIHPESLLPPEALTLYEILEEAGMVTGHYPGNINASGVFDLDKGVQYGITDPRTPPNPWLGTALGDTLSAHTRLIECQDLNRYVHGFLDAVQNRRFFLYVHYNDPHDPYRPPKEILDRFDPDYDGRVVEKPHDRFKVTDRELEHMLARYDGEIVSVFNGVTDLLQRLEDDGLLEETLVILSVDHGEEFLDHGGWTHARTAYEEIVSVPLFVRPPGGGPASVDAEVNQVDLAPTVLDYVGLAAPMHMDGFSLRPMIENRDDGDPTRPVLVEGHRRGIWSFRKGPWKVIEYENKPGKKAAQIYVHLFNLDDDPGEQNDLSKDPEHARRVEALLTEGRATMQKLRDRALLDQTMVIDEDLEAELRALGYVR